MKIVSLNEKFCSVRILFTIVTLPYMSHIIGVVLNCSSYNIKAYSTVKRLKG